MEQNRTRPDSSASAPVSSDRCLLGLDVGAGVVLGGLALAANRGDDA